ncbi:MAG: glycosyltransferase family 4 protein [Longimicrobiales bacterium]
MANFESDVGYAWWMMERFWIQVAETCARQGTRCYVAYPRINTVPDAVAASPLEPLALDMFDRTAAGRARIVAALEEHAIGAVYFTDQAFRDPFYGSLRRHGVDAVVNHDHTPGDRPPSRGLRGLLSALSNRLPGITCDLWVAISPLIRQRALTASRIPAVRCVVVQNGIDRDTPGPAVREEARRRLGLDADDIAVISVGRAIRYKGLDFSLALAARAVDDGLDRVVFIHAGDGPDFEEFESEAKRLGLLPDRYRLPGRMENVPMLLEGCDLALHPSRGEGFSLAVLEYMRAGLPVLVPDRPTVCQAIRSGETGIVYRAEDVGSALEGLRSLAESGERRRIMGAAARAEMLERYTWERTASDFQPVADFLAGVGERPRP